ncbi:MFS transporter [Plantactinospora sp. BC1]|uniref:MFS transporter n=1 Tax=unclassified Plantactinospora TaxID=2631981 RepID=UPI00131F07FA|nr:MFS transporter [Plantactinospora sp. BC1]
MQLQGTKSWRFRLLWSGQSVSVIGDGAAALAIPLLVLTVTGSAVATALAAAARTIAYLLFGLTAGTFVDRWDVRRTMIFCDVVRAVTFLVLPIVATFNGGIWIVPLAVAAASAGIFFETALAVAVQDSIAPEQLTGANAKLEFSNQVGLLLGPASIGVAIATIGVEKCLWLNAATFAVSVVTLVPLRFRDRPPGERETGRLGERLAGIWRETRAGLRYIWANSLLVRLVSLQAVINFVIAAETLVVFHADRGLHATSIWTGVVLAAAGLGGIVATGLAAWFADRFSAQALIAWSVIALGGSLLALAGSANPLQLAISNGLLGALSVFASVHIRTLRQRIVPREVLGRVTATARTLAFAANPVGAALFGLVAQAAGGNARWSFLAATVLSVASAAVAYRGLLRPARESAVSPVPGDGE